MGALHAPEFVSETLRKQRAVAAPNANSAATTDYSSPTDYRSLPRYAISAFSGTHPPSAQTYCPGSSATTGTFHSRSNSSRTTALSRSTNTTVTSSPADKPFGSGYGKIDRVFTCIPGRIAGTSLEVVIQPIIVCLGGVARFPDRYF